MPVLETALSFTNLLLNSRKREVLTAATTDKPLTSGVDESDTSNNDNDNV